MASFRDAALGTIQGKRPSFKDIATLDPLERNTAGETLEEASRGQFERGFDQSIAGQKGDAYSAVKAIGDKTGFRSLAKFGAEGAERASREASALPRLAQPSIQDVENFDDVLDWAAGGFGQLGGSLATMVPAAAAGAAAFAAAPVAGATAALGAGVGTFLASAVPAFGGTYADIEEETGDQAFWTSLATGSAVGALDKIAAGKLVRAGLPNSIVAKMTRNEALNEAEKRGVKAVASNILKAAGTEAATEPTQEFIQKVGRQQGGMDIDPLSEESINEYINAAALGALGGGTIGTAGAGLKQVAAGAARGADAIQSRLPQRFQPQDTAVPETRATPEQVMSELEGVPPLQLDSREVEARNIMQLRESIDTGAVAAHFERADPDNAERIVESIEKAMDLVQKFMKRPDLTPTAEQLAFMEAVFNHSAVAQFMPEFDTEGTRSTEQGYEEALATTDLESQEAALREQMEAGTEDARADLAFEQAQGLEDDATVAQDESFEQSITSQGLTIQNEQGVTENFEGFNVSSSAQKGPKGEPMKRATMVGLEGRIEAENKKLGLTGKEAERNRQKRLETWDDNADKHIEKMNKEDPDNLYEKVSLLEATTKFLTQQAREKGLTGQAATEYIQKGLATRAKRELQEGDSTANLYDPENPGEYLKLFSVVKKTPRGQAAGLSDTEYKREELNIGNLAGILTSEESLPAKETAFASAKERLDAAKAAFEAAPASKKKAAQAALDAADQAAQDAFKELSTAQSNLRKAKGGGFIFDMNKNEKNAKPEKGYMDIEVDGTPKKLRASNLVNKEIAKKHQKTTDDFIPDTEMVKDAFLRGLSSLIANNSKRIKIRGQKVFTEGESGSPVTNAKLSTKAGLEAAVKEALILKRTDAWLKPELVLWRGQGGATITVADVFPTNDEKKLRTIKQKRAELADRMIDIATQLSTATDSAKKFFNDLLANLERSGIPAKKLVESRRNKRRIASARFAAQIKDEAKDIELPKAGKVELTTSPVRGYAARTGRNANAAPVTVAIAVDHTTAGERLTQKKAKKKITKSDPETLSSPGGMQKYVNDIVKRLKATNGTKINVAGNGLHTWALSGRSQTDVNRMVYAVLKEVKKQHPQLQTIVSGGQTGTDMAGLVAARALGLDIDGHFPPNFLQRTAEGKDVQRTEAAIQKQIEEGAKAVLYMDSPAGQKLLRAQQGELRSLNLNDRAPSGTTPRNAGTVVYEVYRQFKELGRQERKLSFEITSPERQYDQTVGEAEIQQAREAIALAREEAFEADRNDVPGTIDQEAPVGIKPVVSKKGPRTRKTAPNEKVNALNRNEREMLNEEGTFNFELSSEERSEILKGKNDPDFIAAAGVETLVRTVMDESVPTSTLDRLAKHLAKKVLDPELAEIVGYDVNHDSGNYVMLKELLRLQSNGAYAVADGRKNRKARLTDAQLREAIGKRIGFTFKESIDPKTGEVVSADDAAVNANRKAVTDVEKFRSILASFEKRRAQWQAAVAEHTHGGTSAMLSDKAVELLEGDPRTKEQRAAIREAMGDWLEKLGVPEGQIRFMDTKEYLEAFAKDPLALEALRKLLVGNKHGFAIEASDGTTVVFVNPLIDPATALEKASHEVGHGMQKFIAERMTPVQAQQIVKDFLKWREQNSGEKTSVERILASKKTYRAKLAALAGHSSQLQLRDLSAADQEYLLDFKEWFADRVGTALINGTRKKTANARIIGTLERLKAEVAALEKEMEKADGARTREINQELHGLVVEGIKGKPVRVVTGKLAQLEAVKNEVEKLKGEGRHRVSTAMGRYLDELRKMATSLYDNKFNTQKDANAFLASLNEVATNEVTGNDVWKAIEAEMPALDKLSWAQEAKQEGTVEDAIMRMINEVTGKSFEHVLKEGKFTNAEITRFKQQIIYAARAGNVETAWKAAHVLTMRYALNSPLFGSDIRAALGRAATSPHVQRQLFNLLKNDDKALARMADPEKGGEYVITYMYMAHQMGQIDLQPKVRGIFAAIAKMLRQIAGIVENTEQANDIYRAMHAGELVTGGYTVTTQLKDNHFRSAYATIAEIKDKWDEKFNPLQGANAFLIDSGIPGFSRLARMFDNAVGETLNAETFMEERQSRSQAYMNQYERIMQGQPKEMHDKVLDLLRNYKEKRDGANPDVKRLADDILIMFNDMYSYFDQAGLAGSGSKRANGEFVGMGKRGEQVEVTRANGKKITVSAYFPWMLDPEKILTDEGQGKLSTLLNMPEYHKKMEQFRDINKRQAEGKLQAIREGHWEPFLGEPEGWSEAENKFVYSAEQIAEVERVRAESEALIKALEHAGWKQYLIDYMIQNLASENGLADSDPDINPERTGHIPKMTASNPRSWYWITESFDKEVPVTQEARDIWFGLQADSLSAPVRNYVEQGVKRASYVRRFGANGHRLQKILNQARKEGATELQIRQAKKYIDAMLGTHGWRTHLKIHEYVNKIRAAVGKEPLPDVVPGKPISRRMMKVQQWLMTYQNIRLLDFAVLTSLMDPVGIFARTGDIRMSWQAWKDGVRSMARGTSSNPDMLASIGEMLGIIESNVMAEALQWNYAGNYMTGGARKVNDLFFKWNGLSGWTKTTRLMAVSAGQQFMKFHIGRYKELSEAGQALSKKEQAGETLSPEDQNTLNMYEQSERYLNELGLRPLDLERELFDEDGNLKLMSRDELGGAESEIRELKLVLKGTKKKDVNAKITEMMERREELRAALASEQRVRTALIRFTNEAVLRPNAAQRPMWASDPHFAVIFHLKQFIWSFHSRILGRMGYEAMQGNTAPVIYSAIMFAAVMAASDELRDEIKFGDEGNPNKADWGFTDYLWSAIQRAGLTGTYQSLLDSREDMSYGGWGFESFVGPTFTQAMRVMKVPFRDSEYLWKQMNSAVPLNNTRQSLGMTLPLGEE